MYLLYLSAPDWVHGASGALSFAMHVLKREGLSQTSCRLQSIYIVFVTTCRAYLTAILATELQYMLVSSTKCLRYEPPTHARATKYSLLVYLWSLILALWTSLGYDWNIYPAPPQLRQGLVCMPIDGNPLTQWILWTLVAPVTTLGPFLYSFIIAYKVRKLLPRKGQRRTLALYYFRIALGWFVLFIPPYVALVALQTELPKWMVGIAGILGQSQVLVAALCSLYKPDIALAVAQLFACCGTRTIVDDTSSSHHDDPSVSYGGTRMADFSSLGAVESHRNMKSELDVVYDDVPRQSDRHYQFDDELDPEHNADDIIAHNIEEEQDESSLPVCPFG